MSVLVSRLVLVIVILQGGGRSSGDRVAAEGAGPLAFTAGQSGGVWGDAVRGHTPGGGVGTTLPRVVYAVRGAPLLLRCELGSLTHPLHRLDRPTQPQQQPQERRRLPPLPAGDDLYDDPYSEEYLARDYAASRPALHYHYYTESAQSQPQYYDYYNDDSTSDLTPLNSAKAVAGPPATSNGNFSKANSATSNSSAVSSSVLFPPSPSSSSPPPPPSSLLSQPVPSPPARTFSPSGTESFVSGNDNRSPSSSATAEFSPDNQGMSSSNDQSAGLPSLKSPADGSARSTLPPDSNFDLVNGAPDAGLASDKDRPVLDGINPVISDSSYPDVADSNQPSAVDGSLSESDRSVSSPAPSAEPPKAGVTSQSAVFSAATVTWLKNDVEVSDRRHVTTAAGHLNITKVVVRRGGRTSDEGEYRCVVHTAIGNISGPPVRLKVANLSRNFRVGVSKPASEGRVVAGGAVRFQCSVDSHPPAELTWFRDGTPLAPDHRLTVPEMGVLQIAPLEIADSGMYRCVARNILANKTRSSVAIAVTVEEADVDGGARAPDSLSDSVSNAASFLSPYHRQRTANRGGNLTLECFATGRPLPRLLWHRARTMDGPWSRVEEGPNYAILGQGNLRLLDLDESHEGFYACSIAGTDHSQEIEVMLNIPPKIEDPPKNLVTLMAKTSRLNCSVSGWPHPSVLWYKNGKLIEQSGRIQMKRNQLIFTNSVTADSALYQCVALNDAGYASSWAHMFVNSSSDSPKPPRDLRYQLLSSTSVLITWSSSHVPSPQAYTLHITQLGSMAEQQIVVLNTSHVFKDLALNTNYSVYVRAFTDVASDPSDPIVFRTGEEIPTGVPKMKLQVASATELLVQWSPLPPAVARGTITGYKVQWKQRKIHYYNVKETSPNVHEMMLTGLQPGTNYSVRVLAGNSVGYPEGAHLLWKNVRLPDREDYLINGGGKGSRYPHNREESYRTPAPLPTPLPLPPLVNLTVHWVGHNTSDRDNQGSWAIEVTWEPAKHDVAALEGYSLRYRPENGHWRPAVTMPASNTSYIIAGLGSGWYQVEVRGFNLAGDGDPTVEIIQAHARNSSSNLGSSLSPEIEQLEVEVQSQTSVQLWWRVAEQHKKLVSFYTVRYLTIPPSPNEPTQIIHSMVNEVLVTGLKPFTWYEFSVRAHISENVYGPYCPVVEVSTTDRVPAAPTDLQYQPLDASTVLVTWQAPSSPAAAAAIGTSESHTARQVTPQPTMYELLYSQNKSLALPLWTKISVMSDKTQSKVG